MGKPVLQKILAGLIALIGTAAHASTLSGSVNDAHTQAPLQGASVIATVAGTTTPYATSTDAAGLFSLDVPDGQATVVVQRAGYFDATTQIQTPTSALAAVQMEIENIVVVTLRDAVSGESVSSPTVILYDFDRHSPYDSAAPGFGGTAVFIVPTGVYSVCQSSLFDQYLDSCYDDHITGQDGSTTLTPLPIGGGTTTAVSLSLHVGATISGRLVDHETGLPIDQQVFISLFSPSQASLPILYTYTQSDGAFSIAGIVPGDYYLAAGADTRYGPLRFYTTTLFGGGDCRAFFSCDFSTAQLVHVPATGFDGIDLSLSPGDLVSGTVYDRDTGQPLPGAAIYTCANLSDGFFTVGPNTTADAQGRFNISHTDVYTMTFTARAGGYVTSYWPSGLVVGDTLNEGSCAYPAALPPQSDMHHYAMDIYMPRQSANGRFFGRASANSGIYEHLPPLQAKVVVFQFGTGETAATTHTDPNGAYVSPPLPDGRYVVTAYLDDGGECTTSNDWFYDVCNTDQTYPNTSYYIELADGLPVEANLGWPDVVIFRSGFDY